MQYNPTNRCVKAEGEGTEMALLGTGRHLGESRAAGPPGWRAGP